MGKKKGYQIVTVLMLALALTSGVANADIDSDLVAWWAFNDGNGNTAIDSASGIDGTLKPGLPNGPMWVAGQIGDCLEFDTQLKTYVECGPHPALNITGSITLSAWVKKIGPWIGAGGDLRYDTILYKTLSAGGNRTYRLSRNASADGVALTVNAAGGEAKVRGSTAVNDDQWHHVAGVYDLSSGDAFVYVDGNLDASGSTSGNIMDSAGQPLLIGYDGGAAGDVRYWGGLIDEVRVYTRALSPEDVTELFASTALATGRENASRPSPDDGAPDMSRDAMLRWAPGDFVGPSNGHVVYFGENFDDVNDAMSGGVTLDVASYDPGRLAFDTTYYWRVDEVNSAPDFTVFKGDVWNFTTEPISIPITNIEATASGSFGESVAEKTIDGSGLVNDLHGTSAGDMWISDGIPATVEYAFDKVYKLHELWIWNSNQLIEGFVGFGGKDVVLEHSLDGESWSVLEGVGPLAPGPGREGYAHNTTIDLRGAVAQQVRVTINSVQGIAPQASLSEVRFSYIPTTANKPSPESGASDVSPDVTLSWGRDGREADRHEIYLGSDPDDLPLVGSVDESSFDTLALDLQLGQTYHWRVDEVNEAMDPSTWAGDIWVFSAVDRIVIDDMESYEDQEFLEIWATWADGFEDPTNGSFVGNGATGSPERSIVHGGKQSLPLHFDNSTAQVSETTRTFEQIENWSRSGIETLVLLVAGSSDNVGGQLYVKINDAKVQYDGSPAMTTPSFTQWNIDLASVGTDLGSVKTLSIGVDGAGAMGVLYVDDIRLYAQAPEP